MAVTEIRFKLMPAVVKIINESQDINYDLAKALIFVTNRGIHIYVDSFDGPVEEFQSPLLDIEGNNKTGWTATTDDGYTISFSRSQGCLCGSRLKSFDPFRGVPYTNTLY